MQQTELAVFPPGDAREDWTIIRALSERLGHTLPYDNVGELHGLMFDEADALFGRRGAVADAHDRYTDPTMDHSAPFALPIDNFYMTCPISRASETMAECTVELGLGQSARTGTDG